MSGSVTNRGNNRWMLKWDLPRERGEKRQPRYKTVTASNKKEAKAILDTVTASITEGRYVDPSKRTLGDCLDDWLAKSEVNSGAKTLERYREIVKNQIRPKLGPIPVQKMTAKQLTGHYTELQKTLSKRTAYHAHRIIFSTLAGAMTNGYVMKNVAADAERPKPKKKKMVILDQQQINALLDGLRGKSLYLPVAVLVSTGMRRGEMCALRWNDINFDDNRLTVDENIEETKEFGRRVKAPKTEDGERTIAVAPSLTAELKLLHQKQLAAWFSLTGKRLAADRFIFGDHKNNPRSPNGFTKDFTVAVAKLKLPKIGPHTLRHTHASQLIDAGVDVVKISHRLGHASPEITLRIYAHLFKKGDTSAADVMEKALSAALAPR